MKGGTGDVSQGSGAGSGRLGRVGAAAERGASRSGAVESGSGSGAGQEGE